MNIETIMKVVELYVGKGNCAARYIREDLEKLASTAPPQVVADTAMAMHWIDRYAAGIDDECQLDRVADALLIPPQVEYDRDLIASMLETCESCDLTRAAMSEQVRLLRAADNRDSHARTVKREPQVEGGAADKGLSADYYTAGDLEYWLEHPADIVFVQGLKVGDRYELQAIDQWTETYEVTKAPDETSDDYDVRRVSPAPAPTTPGDAPADVLAGLKDPTTVHVLMLRGTIATPSWRSIVDLRGEVPNGEERQLARIAELQEQIAALPTPGDAEAVGEGLTVKQSWWAGYRAGKGLPYDTSRQDALYTRPAPAVVDDTLHELRKQQATLDRHESELRELARFCYPTADMVDDRKRHREGAQACRDKIRGMLR